MDEVSAYPCLRIGRVPEVLEAAARKIIEERIVMVPGDGKASTADCGSSYTAAPSRKVRRSTNVFNVFIFLPNEVIEIPRSSQINVR